jgi:hypothetical protein
MEAQTVPLHLSVYEPVWTNSSMGTISVPVGDFMKATHNVCGDSFDRYKTYYPFCGPGSTVEQGIFENTNNDPNLHVTTCDVDNGTMDTAIQILGNYLPLQELDCDNDTSCVGQSKLSYACTPLPANKTVRIVIYYKSSSLTGQTVVKWSWLYTTTPCPL